MSTPYTSIFDYVLPDVPGCPQALATRAIRDACIEFCERTNVWTIDHPAINAVANQASYPFAPGVAGAVAHKAMRVWYNKQEIDPATPDQLNGEYAGDWRTKSGIPKLYTQYNARNLILVPYPTADLASGITLIVSLKPSRSSTDIDTTIFEEYVDKIAHGVKATLMLSPKKPYSNPELGAAEKGMFDNAIAEVADRVNRAFTRARRRVSPSFF